MAKQEKKKGGGKSASKKKAAIEVIAVPENYIPRLQVKYRDEVSEKLMKHFSYTNKMQLPTVEKVILNIGMGDAHQDQRLLDSIVDELEIISGQKPVITRAKKAISNFKLREGMQVGARVTLRRSHMWEFLDRLFSITLPRVRDFRGLSDKSFDGRGNYNLGIKEQIVFPEIDYDRVVKLHGMNITITTTAKNDEEGRALLEYLGCPFVKRTPQAEEA